MSKLFPELDELDLAPTPEALKSAIGAFTKDAPDVPAIAAPTSNTAPQKAAAITERAQNPKVIELFEKALALPKVRTGGQLRVVRCERDDDSRVLFEIAAAPAPGVVFWILPPGSPGFLATPDFTLVLRGDTSPLADQILRYCAKKLARLPYERLLALVPADIIEDPALGGAFDPHGHRAAHGDNGNEWPPADPDDSYMNTIGFGYAPPGAWRNFFQGHENSYGGIENARGYCQKFEGKVAYVSHTEIECAMSSPTRDDGSIQFWNHLAPIPSTARNPREDWGQFLFTDMQETEVIKGGAARLDEALASLADSGYMPDVVVLPMTCTTQVIGDDTGRSVEKLKKRGNFRVLNNADSKETDLFAVLLKEASERTGFKATAQIPRSVNLMGFPLMPGYQPFIDLLTGAGVTINSRILPKVTADEVQNFMAAELTVLFDWPHLDATYTRMLDGLGVKLLRPPPPIGVANTRAFFAELGAALGDPGLFDAQLDARWKVLEPTWNRLQKKARTHRLGLIGAESLVTKWLETRQMFGVKMLELLEEMGFGVDLVMVPQKGRVARQRMTEEGRRRTIWVESAEELEVVLTSSDAAAYYTEAFFDRRLSRSGRNLFSVREFGRIGLDGAVDALRLLVSACEVPFFRTYGRYCGKPFSIGHL
ncbi:MAG: nitrogenase component 1 [Byssovorax sp.]